MSTADDYLSTVNEVTVEGDANCDEATGQTGTEQPSLSSLQDQGNVAAGVHFKQVSSQRDYLPVSHDYSAATQVVHDELADEGNGSDITGCNSQQQQRPKRQYSNRERRREMANMSSNDESVTHLRFLHFMWRCDLVEKWISEKEIYVKGENFGQTLSSVQVFLSKQAAFSNKLAAYAVDAVYPLFDLRDRLLKGNHQLTAKIINRHDQVMVKWHTLRSTSEAREMKLTDMFARHKMVDDALAKFARKASALHSWCEKAEEYLTSPVRCTTSDELASLRAKLTQFVANMCSTRRDLEELEVLDARIKAIRNIHVPKNPYTRLTVESLHEIWNNLDSITNERDDQLKKEAKRQHDMGKTRVKLDLGIFSWLTHVPMFAPFRWL